MGNFSFIMYFFYTIIITFYPAVFFSFFRITYLKFRIDCDLKCPLIQLTADSSPYLFCKGECALHSQSVVSFFLLCGRHVTESSSISS